MNDLERIERARERDEGLAYEAWLDRVRGDDAPFVCEVDESAGLRAEVRDDE